ncbi:MAG: hypothetical protein JHC33_09040, partial [Ignisphaera sp.]|nr:hypothetical protein [Ignisphaera sp.]
MIEYFERNYGADADGNRGISFWTFELEPSDEPYIKEQVMELLEGYDEEDYPKTVTVSLFSNAT